MRGWRNWQTHYLEVVAPARAWRFESSPAHQNQLCFKLCTKVGFGALRHPRFLTPACWRSSYTGKTLYFFPDPLFAEKSEFLGRTNLRCV